MAQVVYSQNALANLERAFAFLVEHDPNAASAAARAIRHAVETLSKGRIVLYRFLPEQNLIRILAIRHQRELDYPV